MKTKKITGIILAGGKSSRMGEEKGLVEFRGIPMIEYSIKLFQQLGYSIVIVSNDHDYDHYGFPVYADLIEDKGPMAGIYSALENTTTEWNAVITCDVPLINSEVFEKLEENRIGVDAVMPRYEKRLQPLTALYKTCIKGVLLSSIQEGQLQVRKLHEKIATQIIEFDLAFQNSFSNMNTKEDIEQCK